MRWSSGEDGERREKQGTSPGAAPVLVVTPRARLHGRSTLEGLLRMRTIRDCVVMTVIYVDVGVEQSTFLCADVVRSS